MLSKKRNGWLWVVMLFAVCAVVYGMLSSYPRELAVYSDELRYLDVARSLLQGRGLRVRNMPSDYQKILYPLCILPALLLKTTAAQITAIGWLNAVYMASAVFPAYALARAMGMNRRRTTFLVGVSAAHDVRCEYVYERDGVSAAVAVAGVFFPAGDAGRAEGPCGLVRGGGGVLLPAVSEQGGRALLSDRLGACAHVGLVA